MAVRRGISILDLINLPPGSQTLLPPDIAAQLERLAVLEHHSTTSEAAYIHYGVIQSVADDFSLPALRNWPVEVPGLNAGLLFRLLYKRTAPSGAQNLEPASDSFLLDLFLERVAIKIPGLRPAKLVPSSGTTAAHLVPDKSLKKVSIFGSGILRIASSADGGAPVVRFIDNPDPFDPDAPTGPVFTLGFDPPHFFVGDSNVGLTVDRLTYDDSEEFTPADIMARGQPASWRGIAIKEATVYLPRNAPVVGDLSVGVRDVLLGSPFGLQGELRIEFGQTPVDPALVSFYQQISGHDSLLAAPEGSGVSRKVTFAAGTHGTASIRAMLPSGATGKWVLPDGTDETGVITRYFDAREGDILKFKAVETVDGDAVESPEVQFVFQEADTAVQSAPKINVTLDSQAWNNVLSLSGTAASLNGIAFAADPPSDDLTWQLGSGSAPASGRGGTFSPVVPNTTGNQLLQLSDASHHHRRLRIELLSQGELVVGTADGVFAADGSPVPMRSVQATYDLKSFYDDGQFSAASAAATLSNPTTIDVPTGEFAEVTVELGTHDDPNGTPSPVPAPEPLRKVQVLMDFNDTNPLRWGDSRPPGSEPFSEEALRNWAAQFSGAQFVIIGRSCDIGTKAHNKQLSLQRAEEGKNILTSSAFAGPAVPAGSVFVRGEQFTWSDPAGQTAENNIVPPLSHDESAAAASDPGPDGWLIERQFTNNERAGWGDDRNRSPRPSFRRVDIYAVGGTAASDTPTEPQDEQNFDPALRRALIPGSDRTSVDVPAPREPQLPYRVRLVVRWDSPTVSEWADAIPTLAELTVAWQAEPLPVPSGGGNVIATRDPSTSGPEVFTFVGRWSYDAKSGETVFSLALNSAGDPDGLFVVVDEAGGGAGNILATALALGPALMAGIGAADVSGAAVRIGALVAASTAAAFFAKDGKVVVFGIEIEEKQKSLTSLEGSRQRILFDYSVQIGFEVGAAGISINAEKPIKVRYKNVGIELDNSRSGIDKFGMVYEDVSFEIEDPGQWVINGPLGELLRVTGARAGSGSTWYEIDLAFALDLGVITITGATVRVTFESGSVGLELRGLAASVDIPGTLRGSGRLSVGDGGLIRAGLDVEIIPAQVIARGSLALQADVGFVAIEVGVIFAVGIPLASTGLGIFGFIGRFVSNGKRNIPAITDPVEREIQWYRMLPENKYVPFKGQWALGLGAVVGTLPDTAFTFNALGMLSIAFPDPSVVFGIDAKFISQPSLPTEQGDSPPPGTLLLLGIIAVDSTAVKIGIRGSYEIPKLVHISVPVSAYFPYPSTPGDAYVRIGADGYEGRSGDPVTIKLLPGILDVTAWAYLMIEEKQLHRLGGDDRFSFDGFSIGFGSGWGIEWSAGPIKLSASAKILVGLGTHPLMVVGGVFVRGELSLVVVSISARGEIILKLTESEQRLDGKFCGKVDFFFFSIEGCVGISIGTDPGDAIPVPESPILKVDLTDRRGIVTGSPTGGTPGPGNTVWPDTVPVIQFSHFIRTQMESGAAFHPTPEYPGPVWSGTSELKYAFRLINVEIIPHGEAALSGPLESAWWLPSHRGGVMTTDPDTTLPSEQEGRSLALLSWHPAPWARNLGEGGEDAPGDPSGTVGEVCDPTPEPLPNCALGQNAFRLDVSRVVLPPDGPGSGPFPSYFEIIGRESFGSYDMETLVMLAAEYGLSVEPGEVQTLPAPFTISDHPGPLAAAYQLPYISQRGNILATLQFDGDLSPAVVQPELVLVVCFAYRGETKPQTVCDDFTDVEPGTRFKASFSHNNIVYENMASSVSLRTVDWMPSGNVDGLSELNFSDRGVRIRLPVICETVTVWIAQFNPKPVTLRALDAGGAVLDEVKAPPDQKVEIQLTVKGSGLSEVVLTGGGGEGVLMRICYTFEAAGETVGNFTRALRMTTRAATGGGLPRVQGIISGDPVEWKPQIIGRVNGQNRECVFLRYIAPEPGAWRSFRILPWMRYRLGILSCCGVSWDAQQAHDDDQQARNDFVLNWNLHATDGLPSRKNLLQPDTIYNIRVKWQWQGWRKSDSENQPPPIDDSNWSATMEETFTFRTARSFALPPNPEPVDFTNESRFDPRGVARYLIGFEPDGKGAPHFLDDPIRVHFSVDHLEQLLTLYHRDLVLKIRRTDPPAGSLSGMDHPPDEGFTISWQPLADKYLAKSDLRMVESARLAPCLEVPPLGGTTGEIIADLEPNAEYDLMLVAPPEATPGSDEVLIARTHFRTSRYHSPADMLRALGFTNPDPFPILPHDALVTTSLPTGTVLENDQALEQALNDLGLDPWPLPSRPRAVTIWQNSGDWKLLGVLLETDEALERPDRLTVTHAQAGSGTLLPIRSNASGSRILLGLPSGVGISAGNNLTVLLTEPAGPVSGSRELAGGPRVAYQEGIS